MKSTAAKSLHTLLALFILAAALAPVCSGSENCSMPCCRDKAQPVSHSMDMASGRSCCTHSADDFADNLSACRFGNTSPALPSGVESAPGMTAAVGTGVFDHPIERPSHKPLIGFKDTRLRGAPLYLQLHTLLI
jgi:hypothetical protein